MFLKRKRTIWERLLISSVIALHINLVLPMSDILPLPKKIKDIVVPKAHAEGPNQPPTLLPIGNKTVTTGETLEFTISATDPEGDPLTYLASNLPEGAEFDPVIQAFNWTPSSDQAGTYQNVRFTAAETRDNDDAETKLLLHFNADFSDSSLGSHIPVNYGDASIDTAVKKFGAGSLKLTNGRLTVANHPDWELGSGDFTIDWWEYRLEGFGTVMCRQDGIPVPGFIAGYIGVGSMEMFTATSGGAFWDITGGAEFGNYVPSAWSHIAVVRSGSIWSFFRGGIKQFELTDSKAILPGSGPITIGRYNNTNYFNGYIDELRITKGIARWTADFTPPVTEYSGSSANRDSEDITITVNNANTAPTVTITPSAYSVTAGSGFTLHVTAEDANNDPLIFTLKQGERDITVPPANPPYPFTFDTPSESFGSPGIYGYTI
ncbi:MAG: LamG-like jellyroll fold domain-containing protein, partial [Candidatus Omnitrophota bacterium]|nr:LamG-like jellyroll fold domain-containing protein [Candidatus Omnitrophota bacterium]